jgi:hypothetical protein
MRIPSPLEWLHERGEQWDATPPMLKNLIAGCFVALALLACLALWFGGGM